MLGHLHTLATLGRRHVVALAATAPATLGSRSQVLESLDDSIEVVHHEQLSATAHEVNDEPAPYPTQPNHLGSLRVTEARNVGPETGPPALPGCAIDHAWRVDQVIRRREKPSADGTVSIDAIRPESVLDGLAPIEYWPGYEDAHSSSSVAETGG